MHDSAEIICIGTEILLGNIVNTNSAEISRGLADLGINLYHHTVVGDNPQRLKDALEIAFSRCNIVITTGGLGPTYDDLSKETIAEYFGVPLEMHEESQRTITDFFKKRGYQMTENNLKQAMMPKGCTVLHNANGTAPGAIVEGKGKIAIMLPGPPREMAPMFQDLVIPYLQKRSDHILRSHNVYFFGIGESSLEAQLREEMQSMQNPTMAPYAKDGEVMLRITAAGQTEEETEALMAPVLKKLQADYKQYIYGIDVDDLQTALVRALTAAGKTIAAAESCTGGYVAKRITDVPGSSEVFQCGAVTYSNEIKSKMIGVQPETLEKYGAVSEQTACEMAEGVRKLSGADMGISTTGIAGPGGGSDEKPVGLVYIGISYQGNCKAVKLELARGYKRQRSFIRYLASSHALHLALKTITGQ